MHKFIDLLVEKFLATKTARLWNYGIAILAIAIATSLKLLLSPIIPVETTYWLYFVAVMVSSWYGGWQAGILATFLSTLIGNYFFLTPTQTLLIDSLGQMVSLGIFISEGLLIAGMISARREPIQQLQLNQQINSESEDMLHLLVDAVQDYAIFMLDPKGYVVSWNKGGQRLIGYQTEEIIGRHFSCFYGQEDIKQGLPELSLKQAVANGRVETEGWRIRKDGSPFPANVVITALRDEAGNLRGFSKITRDITTYKQAQEQLANLNAILEQQVQERTAQLAQARNNAQSTLNILNGIIEGTSDLIVALDLDFRFITFNTAYKQEVTKIYGQEIELGMSLLDAVAHLPTEQARIREFCGRALQGEQFTIIEEFGDSNLECHYYEVNFSPIKDENNHLIGASHLVRNVTERIRMEKRIRNLNQELEERVLERTQALQTEIQERIKIEAILRESEEKFRATFNQAAVGIAHLTINGQYQLVNQKLCEITGYSETELLQLTFQEITYPDDLEADLEYVRQILANQIQTYSMEKRYIRKDGSIIWINLTGSLVRETDGQPKYFIGVIEDISERQAALRERKQAELALHESTAILNAINNTTSTLIYAKDRAGRFLFANPANLAVLGKPMAEVIGKSPTEYLSDSKQGEQIKANDRLVIDSGEVQVYEETVDLPAGRRTFLSTKSPYRDRVGNIIGLIGVSIDISDRIQFEAALEDKNRELSNVFESITDGILYVSKDWRYIYVNPKAEQILGKSQSELIGKCIWEVFPELLESPVYTYTHKTMAKQVSMQYEQFYPMFGNKWLSVRLYPSPKRLTAYLLDITERKLAEIALRQSELHFRNLANSMPQLVWTANPDGTIDYYNQRLTQFSGLVQQDGNWEWLAALHPDDKQRSLETWLYAVTTGEVYECEHRFKRIDGEFRWHLSRGIPVKDEQGRIVKWYGTATDIHSQKQYQAEREQLLRREQLARTEAESASRMKDEFLATLSHELRTPMTAMLGWISMLRTHTLNENITARALETIERTSKTLNQLIEDILDVSRIIRGKVRLTLQPLHLLPVIADVIETVKPSAELKNIQIILEPLQDSIKVMGDRRRCEQIIWNLLANAIKFTPNDGCVTVQLSVLEGTGNKEQVTGDVEKGVGEWGSRGVGEEKREKEDKGNSHQSTVNSQQSPVTRYAQIQVIDTGIGIAPEFFPYVFDRFRQADSSIARSHGGLGLGLALVRHLVELHGGKVSVHSLGIGQGSTFTVKLPLVVESSNILQN